MKKILDWEACASKGGCSMLSNWRLFSLKNKGVQVLLREEDRMVLEEEKELDSSVPF